MASTFIDAIATNGKQFLDAQGQNEDARKSLIATASALIAELENPGEIMARVGWGEPTRTAALRTAFELGLLKKLTDKPASSEDLAAGTKAEPALVARVLKHLAAYGLINESFEGMIPTFHGLPEFLAKMDYQSPSNADDGPVQYGLEIDKPFFAILQSNPRLGSAFNNFMAGYAAARPRWVSFYPFQERLGGASGDGPLVVDVGGGLGHELASLDAARGESFPGQLVLQDLPSVIGEAQESRELPGTVKAVAHDFFEPQPAEYRGARAYFMRLILHDWPDAKCAVILAHLRDAMVKGHSRLLINEAVLADTGAPWQQTSLDWTMMGMLVSRERTESQWRELLGKAGLKISGIWSKDAESVIEAVLEDDEV
ncbi:S-adenosyl-L-methionine-dependent methyltransferase [Thelonectria olida]|uniref:S-adenosyl-L-methionine-dependent methyltransferase n=1 Tax=Thelonectria olida TaxID=1576542 RepID=A0A9P8WH22_9HYPO|nr:S-adenosyl-L-methionine-dependent methyltransferase [Thelonectria olida]